MQARSVIEPADNGKMAIVVTELPYQVNKARLVEQIADLVKEKKMQGISDLRDESDRVGMKLVIELKRDAQPACDPESALQAHAAAQTLQL